MNIRKTLQVGAAATLVAAGIFAARAAGASGLGPCGSGCWPNCTLDTSCNTLRSWGGTCTFSGDGQSWIGSTTNGSGTQVLEADRVTTHYACVEATGDKWSGEVWQPICSVHDDDGSSASDATGDCNGAGAYDGLGYL
jgi:hypothetical protein